jgi:hypothetical protein
MYFVGFKLWNYTGCFFIGKTAISDGRNYSRKDKGISRRDFGSMYDLAICFTVLTAMNSFQ